MVRKSHAETSYNHVNFEAPDATVTDATFGQILSDVSPRILEFAMKYTF